MIYRWTFNWTKHIYFAKFTRRRKNDGENCKLCSYTDGSINDNNNNKFKQDRIENGINSIRSEQETLTSASLGDQSDKTKKWQKTFLILLHTKRKWLQNIWYVWNW